MEYILLGLFVLFAPEIIDRVRYHVRNSDLDQ
jgi:hypothetical protein